MLCKLYCPTLLYWQADLTVFLPNVSQEHHATWIILSVSLLSEAVIHTAAHSQLQPNSQIFGPPIKDLGCSLGIVSVSTVKVLWTSIKLPSQVCERKRFCQSPVKGSKKCSSLLFSAGTVDCHAPSTRLILWLPVRVTKHCCFLAYLPAAGFRGSTGRTIQA